MLRPGGAVFGVRSSGHDHQGHAEQLHQRLQKILRRLRTADGRAQSLHEEGRSGFVARLRSGACQVRQGVSGRGGQDQSAGERAIGDI